MSKPRLIHVPEPQLEFRFGQTVDYPRDGLYLFGPVDAAREPRQVRYGVIGTPISLRRFKDDVSEVKQGFECGIALERYQDVKVGDVIEAYQIEKTAGLMEA